MHCLFLAPLPLKLLILCNSVWEEGHKLPQPPEAAEASGWVPKRSLKLSHLFIHFTFSFDFKNLHIYISVSISELRVMPELETSGCITRQRRNIWRARQGQVHDSTQQQCGNFTQNFSLLLQQWQSAPADPESAQTNNKRTLGTPPLFVCHSGFWGCGDSANFLSDRYLSINALLLFSFHHYLPALSTLIRALWLRRAPLLPQLDLCSAVIWPNKASIRPFQLHYVCNNCLPSPPYCVAVETDEHLTAVGRGCHDNAAHPHPCVRREHPSFFFYLFIFFFLASWALSAWCYGSRKMEPFWLQALPQHLLIRDFFFFCSKKCFKTVREQRGRYIKARPCTDLQPRHSPSVWSRTGSRHSAN